MNGAQLHLALNHLPVVSMLVGALLIFAGLFLKNITVKRTAIAVILFAGLTALPAYFTGEPAEEVVEHKPGVAKADIHEHEELAEIALVFSMISGGLAAGTLLLARSQRQGLEKKAFLATTALSLVTVGLLLQTAHLGGMIRHDELRTEKRVE